MPGIKNILVVDDDKEVREIVKKYLETVDNYKVTVVESGYDAIDFVSTNIVDLMFLDVEMPALNGIITLELIRKNEHNYIIPVAFLTGKEDKDTVLKCISLGVEGYLLKPVNKESLLNKAAEIIKRVDALKVNKTVLLIDDDVEYLKMAKIRLSKYYKVVPANSGKAALEYLGSHSVDLIILDYAMPLYNGKDVLNILRKRVSTQGTPVIMISSLDIGELKEVCDEFNPSEYLSKPVNMDNLIQVISRIL